MSFPANRRYSSLLRLRILRRRTLTILFSEYAHAPDQLVSGRMVAALSDDLWEHVACFAHRLSPLVGIIRADWRRLAARRIQARARVLQSLRRVSLGDTVRVYLRIPKHLFSSWPTTGICLPQHMHSWIGRLVAVRPHTVCLDRRAAPWADTVYIFIKADTHFMRRHVT